MRHFRLGMVIFGLLSVASVAIMEYINMDISNTVDSAADFWWENYKQIYFPAYTRWNPYLFGMVAGILYLRRAAGSQEAILDEATETKVENNNVLLYASYVVTFVVLFGLPAVENYRWHSTLTLHLYESLARTVYGIAITYVVYMCVIGYMKPLNAFLSHDIFFLISQLTYSGYLLHPLYREVIEVIDFTVLGITPFMFISLGILGIIFVMAIALPVYLLIEKPFVNLRPI
jgi:peptidoglycan/LPS O-acetylase OafA/YrhL